MDYKVFDSAGECLFSSKGAACFGNITKNFEPRVFNKDAARVVVYGPRGYRPYFENVRNLYYKMPWIDDSWPVVTATDTSIIIDINGKSWSKAVIALMIAGRYGGCEVSLLMRRLPRPGGSYVTDDDMWPLPTYTGCKVRNIHRNNRSKVAWRRLFTTMLMEGLDPEATFRNGCATPFLTGTRSHRNTVWKSRISSKYTTFVPPEDWFPDSVYGLFAGRTSIMMGEVKRLNDQLVEAAHSSPDLDTTYAKWTALLTGFKGSLNV